MTFQKIWPKAKEAGILDQFLSVMETGKPFVIDDLKYGDDNISGHYRVTAFSLPRNRLAVIFDDMTIHKKLSRRLGETEVKYNALFEKISLGVVYQNKDGEIISANPAAQKILGLTIDQMKGKTSVDPDWKVITRDGKALHGSKHPSMVALKTGKPVMNFVMGVFHPKKEQHHWIRVNAVPEYGEDEKQPFQVFTMFEDITAYIEMEDKQGQAVKDISKGDILK